MPELPEVETMVRGIRPVAEGQDIVRALAAGAHEYVVKPFTDEVIADKLNLLGLVPA